MVSIPLEQQKANEATRETAAPRRGFFSQIFRSSGKPITTEEIARFLDELPHQAAILDASGIVQYVNLAWRQFAAANGALSPCCGVGVNYVQLCEEVQGSEKKSAEAVAAGLRNVLTHHVAFYELEYPCHSPGENRRFLLQACPIPDEHGGAVVVHINVTEQMRVTNLVGEIPGT